LDALARAALRAAANLGHLVSTWRAMLGQMSAGAAEKGVRQGAAADGAMCGEVAVRCDRPASTIIVHVSRLRSLGARVTRVE